ncbi:unnamed protein product [Sympodiomycopsis kandeliae]
MDEHPTSLGQNAQWLQGQPTELELPMSVDPAEQDATSTSAPAQEHTASSNSTGTRQLADDLEQLASLQSRAASISPLWSGRAREANVVRGRQGSVLTRGLVLKTDSFEGANVKPSNLDLSLQGAPNFRKADTPLEVYGVAQPTITGVKTILTALDAAPIIHTRPGRTFTRSLSFGPHDRRGSRSSQRNSPLSSSAAGPVPPQSASQDGSANASRRSSPSLARSPSANARRSVSQQAPPITNAPAGSPPSSSPSLPHQPDQEPRQTVWVCTREEPILYIGARPFVLREQSSPTISFSLSSRAENLEAIERRLKEDVLREAARFNGLIMVHEEAGDKEKPVLHPTWIAVDKDAIKTVREVFDDLRDRGWRCDYHRVPIGRDQPIENNYLDAYTRILRNFDPTRTCIVANCGAGYTRTTFAMVAAQIIRRRQLMLMGHADPFQLAETASVSATPASLLSPTPVPVGSHRQDRATKSMAKSLRASYEKQVHAQSLLRLVQLLANAGSDSPVDVLLGSPNLLDSLRRALTGDFNVIRALCGILDEGLDDKVVVDLAVDSAAHLTNLREEILMERVSFALSGTDHTLNPHVGGESNKSARSHHLDKAVRSLELYFFLCAFASYVNGSQKAVFEHSFADWLKTRSEIWNTVRRIRTKGKQLYLFDPVADLSQLNSSANLAGISRLRLKVAASNLFNSSEKSMAGDEFAEHHIRNLRSGIILRPGTLLKEDVWQAQRDQRPDSDILPVRGTINFRRIPGTAIFASGQPTVDGIRNVIASIAEQVGHQQRDNVRPLALTWLNLREEPLLYIAGKPYVLRDSTLSLRNTKAYGGISWARLQLLEDRLKTDVINELEQNDGRLLLHSESADGEVYPQWKEVQADDVATLQDVMASISSELTGGVAISLGSDTNVEVSGDLTFRRIPFTAERPPDFEDMGTLLQTVLRAHGSSIINNCQLGRGRSTLASVIVLLISQWLQRHNSMFAAPAHSATLAEKPEDVATNSKPARSRTSYHLISSLLRVIPHGVQVKDSVDDAIDRAGSVMNLRDSIEESRIAAEEIEDPENPIRKQRIAAGCQALRRYFSLIVFQAYLNATRPDTFQDMQTFETFVKRQPVLQTIGKELDKAELSLITPLHRIEAADGMALDDEANEVVANRDGSILTAYTMLKSDFFSGIAKAHLSQIEGIPNMRSIPLLVGSLDGSASSSEMGSAGPATPLSLPGRETWGSGMPTVDGLRSGLTKMGAAPGGDARIVWTSLREEPVVYVRGRPHVLRLADQPLTNLEATGITTDTVERQEIAMKNDVIQEAAQREGRVLLHDEVEISPGKFDIIPVWESIKPSDVLTPREAYELVQSEGYQVDYARVAVTDEQAPVPTVFSEIERRVLKALSTGSATAFNCQMGRGRTTTGMIIASLISTVSHFGEELYVSDENNLSSSTLLDESNSNSAASQQRMEGAKDFLDNREDELWLQGEYRMILQLVGVLSHGKLAKKLTDAAIDRMDAVQNLRKAIYDSKLRAENAAPRSKKRGHLSAVYKNYLQRYAFLIAFANYLIEKSRAHVEERRNGGGDVSFDDNASVTTTNTFGPSDQFPSFLAWLKPRREVESIIRHSVDDEISA